MDLGLETDETVTLVLQWIILEELGNLGSGQAPSKLPPCIQYSVARSDAHHMYVSSQHHVGGHLLAFSITASM